MGPALRKMKRRLCLDLHMESFAFSCFKIGMVMHGQYFANLKLSSLVQKDWDESFYILVSKWPKVFSIQRNGKIMEKRYLPGYILCQGICQKHLTIQHTESGWLSAKCLPTQTHVAIPCILGTLQGEECPMYYWTTI